MVDVKLDVGDTSSLKAGFKKKSGTGICRVLMYLLLIGTVTILTLDAAEFITLGIVKDVMGLKVMEMEAFTNMTSAHEKAKTQLVEKERQVKAGSEERDGLKGQVDKFKGEVDNLKKAAADKQKEISAVTGERETLKKENKGLSAEKDVLKKAVADNEKKIYALTQERDTLKKMQAEKIAEAFVKGDPAKTKKVAGKK
jgi:chromosome segregation ATPase